MFSSSDIDSLGLTTGMKKVYQATQAHLASSINDSKDMKFTKPKRKQSASSISSNTTTKKSSIDSDKNHKNNLLNYFKKK